MPASATQFAQLSSLFGKPQALELIAYIDSQVQQPQIQIGVLQEAAPAPASPGTPNRSLDVDFVISPDRDAMVAYTIELTSTLSLSGTSSAIVELHVNGTPITQVQTLTTLVLGLLSLSETHTHRKVLSGYVTAGSTVRLVSTLSGSGVATLISSQEVLVN